MVCALLLGSFLHAKPLFNEHKTTLLEATETSGTITDSPDFVVGSSGVILHKFDAKTSIIVSRFDVVNKNAGKATLRFEKFEMLSQGAFPDAGVKPAVGDEVIVIVMAGDARIDNKKYKSFFHKKAKMLHGEEVESLTGHPIGGVCPFGLKEGIKVYLDESLERFDHVYPACGSPNSAIKLTIPELEKYAHQESWIDVTDII